MGSNWTLFLDRDGVINRRIPGAYISQWEDFEFLPSVLTAIAQLTNQFARIVIVTNQQGIGKGLMQIRDLDNVHQNMLNAITENGGSIGGLYYCPHLSEERCACRKPNPGMAFQAKKDFPAIDFKQSVLVGDSLSDIQFGCRLGMQTVLIETKEEDSLKIALAEKEEEGFYINYRFESLAEFAIR